MGFLKDYNWRAETEADIAGLPPIPQNGGVDPNVETEVRALFGEPPKGPPVLTTTAMEDTNPNGPRRSGEKNPYAVKIHIRKAGEIRAQTRSRFVAVLDWVSDMYDGIKETVEIMNTLGGPKPERKTVSKK